jgi:hypothetical protein
MSFWEQEAERHFPEKTFRSSTQFYEFVAMEGAKANLRTSVVPAYDLEDPVGPGDSTVFNIRRHFAERAPATLRAAARDVAHEMEAIDDEAGTFKGLASLINMVIPEQTIVTAVAE